MIIITITTICLDEEISEPFVLLMSIECAVLCSDASQFGRQKRFGLLDKIINGIVIKGIKTLQYN